jgi:hypothetical protein
MTIRERTPLTKLNKEAHFINQFDPNDLTGLSTEELAQRYNGIDRQSQLFKGLILLEARGRFASDKEFGQWIATHGLSVGSQQSRTIFINLARFFKDKDMEGISMTAAYEISRPENADVAEKIYMDVINKNLSVKEIKQKIKIAKSIPAISLDNSTEAIGQESEIEVEVEVESDEIMLGTTSVTTREIVENESNLINQALSYFDNLDLDLIKKIEVLEKCLEVLNAKLDAETA